MTVLSGVTVLSRVIVPSSVIVLTGMPVPPPLCAHPFYFDPPALRQA
jgi:hypothetical protein